MADSNRGSFGSKLGMILATAGGAVGLGNVQTGFITKPLIMRDGKTTGSYWFVPHEYYDPIKYYIINTNSTSFRTSKVFNYLLTDNNVHQFFLKAGFEDLDK